MNPKLEKFLKSATLVAGTFNAFAPIIKMILVAGGVFALTMFVTDMQHQGVIDGFLKEQKQYKEEVRVALKVKDSLTTENNRHLANARAAQAEVVKLQGQIGSSKVATVAAKKQVDSLKTELQDSAKTLQDTVKVLQEIVPMQDSVIKEQDTTIKLQTKQLSMLGYANFQKDSSIKKLTFIVDTLVKTINSRPTLNSNPEKLFGFIKLPSRKTSLVAGFTIGVGVAAFLLK